MKYFIGVFFAVCTLISARPIDAQARLTPEQVVQFRQAALAARQNNYVLAVDIYETLAELDLVDAQYNLAFLFESGLGRPPKLQGCALLGMACPIRWGSACHYFG